MRIPRLFLDQPLASGTQITLDRDASRYLLQVLRLKPGRELRLFNGDGQDFHARVVDAAKQARVEIVAALENAAESPLQITLIQAISKGERMDYTLQKSVELGVTAIQPVFSARSVVRLDGDRLDKKQQHWLGVMRSACEQCGRSVVPKLHTALPLSDWLTAQAPTSGGLLLAPDASQSLGQISPLATGHSLLIGPEGGLEDGEIAAAIAAGFAAVRMGPRVLRTETAAVAALAVLQARFGDLV
jgi:16S rRNA (uracil1498-N3)-methyltransferase